MHALAGGTARVADTWCDCEWRSQSLSDPVKTKLHLTAVFFGLEFAGLEAISDGVLGDDEPHVGRFGWQGASLSVRDQTTRAFSREMGVTSVDRPNDDCTLAETDCILLARSAKAAPEVSVELLAALTSKHCDSCENASVSI
ncbi:MAG: hypothetical protein JSR66_19290 [Proteobacteria bacterium]|nr:hypothetical protein [Pseudomonadota bacterium]